MKRAIVILVVFPCIAYSSLLRYDSDSASLTYAFRALDLARKMKDKKSEAEACQNLGKTFLGMSQYKQALMYFDLSGKLTRLLRLPDDPIVAECIGSCYKGAGNNKLAVEYFLKALDLYKEKNVENKRYNVFVSLAMIYAEWGWDDHALEFYRKALEIQMGDNDSTAAAYTLSNIAGIYSKSLGNEKGLEYNHQSLMIFRKLNDFRGIAYVLNGIGIYYNSVHKYDSAKIAFREAIRNYQKIPYYEGMSFAYSNLGEIFLKENNQAQALTCFTHSIRLADSGKSEIARCTALTSLGKIYLQTGQIKKASSALHLSLEIAVSRNFKEAMADNYLALATLYKQKGELNPAFHYGRLYIETRDSLFRENSQKVIAEMEARYEAEKKERQIRQLTKENELNKLAIHAREKITLISVISSAVLIILLLFLARFYYLKQRAYQHYVRLTVDHIKKEQKIEPKEFLTASQRLIEELIQAMSAEKHFLDPELTLAEVAQKLNTNTTYLSKAINDLLNKNFSTYINELRIREAQIMLSDNEYCKLSIEGIAISSGFNSKSAFNSAFKKFTGVTPSFFQKSALKKPLGSVRNRQVTA
ncbi:MAG: helix-turn-helix domain-containing protein [Bacteroidetes bacterium]|nr:helix-turn-helix domain-containing protein [Bacteroidota bacterium]